MSLNFKAGQACNVQINFFDNDYFVPDPGSVFWSLYDSTGTLVHGPNSVLTTSTTTKISVTVPAAFNTIPSGNFTYKTIVVDYTRESLPGQFKVNYRLYQSFNTYITPAHVREYLGMTERELPDSAVDILTAYNTLMDKLTPTTFNNVLAAGNIKTQKLHEAIKTMAAINCLPGIKFRYTYKESDGSLTYQRLQNVDLEELEKQLLEDLDNLLGSVDPNTSLASYTVLTRSFRTDPVTGV